MRLLLRTALWLTCCVFGLHALTATLDAMTVADCRAGVHRACEAL
jgi:hypothetical protein